jgi:hypothetical protein
MQCCLSADNSEPLAPSKLFDIEKLSEESLSQVFLLIPAA